MIRRLLIPTFVLSLPACQELPFFSSSSAGSDGAAGAPSTGAAAVDGGYVVQPGLSDFGFGDPTSGVGAPGSSDVGNSADGVAIENAVPQSFFVAPPWETDASSSLPFAIPDPATLPSADSTTDALALMTPGSEVGTNGCGEPPTCYLRTIIATASGRLYSASLSKNYPKDSCVTKAIDCDHVILVGDSHPRYSDRACSPDTPSVSLGFLLPQYLAFGWQAGQIWESTNGFRSEWTLNNAGADSGAYEPIPGQISKLWPAWTRYFAGGEIYGELLVPLRHRDSHRLALGFALFDIRVRR